MLSNASTTITIKTCFTSAFHNRGREKTLDALMNGMSAVKTWGVNNETKWQTQQCCRLTAKRKVTGSVLSSAPTCFDPLHMKTHTKNNCD